MTRDNPAEHEKTEKDITGSIEARVFQEFGSLSASKLLAPEFQVIGDNVYSELTENTMSTPSIKMRIRLPTRV